MTIVTNKVHRAKPGYVTHKSFRRPVSNLQVRRELDEWVIHRLKSLGRPIFSLGEVLSAIKTEGVKPVAVMYRLKKWGHLKSLGENQWSV
jgi:hypothetical protein